MMAFTFEKHKQTGETLNKIRNETTDLHDSISEEYGKTHRACVQLNMTIQYLRNAIENLGAQAYEDFYDESNRYDRRSIEEIYQVD